MCKTSEANFSIGEFAKLFNLSKQTLFYYERNNVLKPSIVEDNGYRYYSLEQYFIFDIIINLRKLGIPLKDISVYLQNRSIENLQTLYKLKQNQYRIQIDIMKRNIENLQINLDRLENAKRITTDRITLEDNEREYYISTPFFDNTHSLKEKIKLVAEHNYPFASNEIINEYPMGYILPRASLEAKDFLNISHLYTRVSHPDEYPQHYIKEEGLHATLYTTQGFHDQYERAFSKLLSFIHLNNLSIIGDAFIEQIRNYYSTDKHNEYIIKIMIPVQY